MKYIILFIHALAIAVYHLLFGDPVSISAKTPENAAPGTEFTIEIAVNKAQVSGFAKLQLELPAGFEAREGESKGGSFTTTGTITKIIWTAVPADPAFTVKIIVKVPANESGDKQISGKFSYIENNVKQVSEFTPVTIKLGGSETATTNTTNTPAETVASTTTATDGQQSFSEPTEPDAVVSANRTITSPSPNNYLVNVTIKKGNIKGFAKLTEKVPAGFKAEEAERSGASYEFKGEEVIFIWTSIPAAEDITVSYKLVSESNVASGAAAISGGEFSYIENDRTKKTELGAQSLEGNTTQQTSTEQPDATIVKQSETVTTTTTETTQTTNTDPQTVTTTNPAAESKTTATETTNSSATENKTTAQEPVTQATPKTGKVHYSVQIGAFKNGVNAGSLGKRFSINEKVKTEMEEGFTKCVVGNFSEYKGARDNRETIRSKGATDAFVTAYNSGKRITVQEALMVSSQKWFK